MSRKSHHREAVAVFLTVVMSSCGALLAAFFIYDPLMIFHAPWGRPLTLHESMRLQAAGVVNNMDFDALILGTSMTENTSADEAGRMLGGRFVNLSITASDYFERSLVLGHALRRRNVQQVIYSLDAGVFGRLGHPVFHREAFDFLYDTNPVNDLRAYMTHRFMECLLEWSDSEGCVGRKVHLDRPNAWYELPEQASRFGGLDNWFKARNDWQVKAALASIAQDAQRVARGDVAEADAAARSKAVTDAIEYVDRYVVRFVEANPQTRFYLVFPPYSRIRFAQWHQLAMTTADAHEATVRHLAEQTSRLPNLEVLGFEDQAFLDDIAHYKDTSHYREDIDAMILTAIAAGTNRLSADNVQRYLSRARARAMAFDLVALGRRIEIYLESVGDRAEAAHQVLH